MFNPGLDYLGYNNGLHGNLERLRGGRVAFNEGLQAGNYFHVPGWYLHDQLGDVHTGWNLHLLPDHFLLHLVAFDFLWPSQRFGCSLFTWWQISDERLVRHVKNVVNSLHQFTLVRPLHHSHSHFFVGKKSLIAVLSKYHTLM
jgi:hypothetical protein